MSIIYEALKKLENKISQNQKEPSPRQHKISRKTTWGLIIFLSLIIIVSLYLVVSTTGKNLLPKPPKKEKPEKIQAPPKEELPPEIKTPKKPPPPQETPVAEKPLPEARPQVELEGILYDEVNPLVIIDKKYYRKGESFQGMKIVDIDKDWVEFEYKGETFKVSIR